MHQEEHKSTENQEIVNEKETASTDSNREEAAVQDNNQPPAAETTAEAEAAPASVADNWEKKYKELNDKYLRLYSEFENFRKRTQREKADLIQFAGTDILKTLLPVVDDFDRALINNERTEDPQVLREGFQLIHSKLHRLLNQVGLEEMKVKGEAFDTEFHEAITNIPAPEESLKGKVVDLAEKGYIYKGKVLRFAKVVVGE